MSKVNKPAEEKMKVPAYIVTFSDMVTLLLTFFVLLLSMANTQDDLKFKKGMESIKRAIATFGMAGFLPGKESTSQFQHHKIKYQVNMDQDQPEDKVIDPKTETLKRAYQQIEDKMSPSNIVGQSPSFLPIDIDFAPQKQTLSEQSQKSLDRFCSDLCAELTSAKATIYIVGLASDTGPETASLILSAKRAKVVSEYITKLKPKNADWEFYYWGSGSGGDWAGKTGVLSIESDIMIGILTN